MLIGARSTNGKALMTHDGGLSRRAVLRWIMGSLISLPFPAFTSWASPSRRSSAAATSCSKPIPTNGSILPRLNSESPREKTSAEICLEPDVCFLAPLETPGYVSGLIILSSEAWRPLSITPPGHSGESWLVVAHSAGQSTMLVGSGGVVKDVAINYKWVKQ